MSDKTIEIPIQGMTCNHCVHAITSALKGVAGVKNVDVSLSEKRARVTYDDSQSDDQALQAAIEAEGYTAQMYGTNSPAQNNKP